MYESADKKVAIFDLRGLDSWNYDWLLVTKPYDFESLLMESLNIEQNIAYTDKCGEFVLFDGTKKEAHEYYSNYCKNHKLILVDYKELEKENI